MSECARVGAEPEGQLPQGVAAGDALQLESACLTDPPLLVRSIQETEREQSLVEASAQAHYDRAMARSLGER